MWIWKTLYPSIAIENEIYNIFPWKANSKNERRAYIEKTSIRGYYHPLDDAMSRKLFLP